jgi:hypothetical protein
LRLGIFKRIRFYRAQLIAFIGISAQFADFSTSYANGRGDPKEKYQKANGKENFTAYFACDKITIVPRDGASVA